ncbi:P1 family peptidase [Breoghania sp.]|uniref:P1 family peptidase n=1 Tax=Breoghania sp. TaxID=2065378 RepID=UPI0026179084|nr:P1 family peptidase [Breoghania sp.]MDJ0932020.1 P1 family peptidase [Breoghania sp.]
MRPGPRNLITEVAGLSVGNMSDPRLKSGLSVVVPDEPAVASIAIHGGAPGTREIVLLEPEQTVSHVDALVLSGGSAFGLDAAAGVQSRLAEMGRGYAVGPVRVPIVPAAILFDLLNGSVVESAPDASWNASAPYRDLGRAACDAAGLNFALGSEGAGTGATTANLKGGLGSASAVLPNGATVGALVAVNALGRVTIGNGPHFWSAAFEEGDEFGGYGLPNPFPFDSMAVRTKADTLKSGANTTIAVIATDVALTKSEAKRLAVVTHDGMARSIWPSHTPLDGDLVFALSTGKRRLESSPELLGLGVAAAATLSRAIARGVYFASEAEGDHVPTWAATFG